MRCEECGNEFRPSGYGKKQKYCSAKCKQAAYRKRRRSPRPRHDPIAGDDPVGARHDEGLDRRTFERMMDDSMEDVLRMNRDRLKAALQDPSTPANALPGISRQLISVCERLQGMDGQTNLFDDETMGVTEDVGASIV